MAVRPYSLVLGRDCQVLPILLSVHAVLQPDILDCTYNTGTMWKGVPVGYKLKTIDIDPQYKTDAVGDFRNMPFDDASFDVIVFDPPHLPVAAYSDSEVSQRWSRVYGNTADGEARQGDNVVPLFLPFLLESIRVLRPGGIVLAKITDMVHNHRYQWQHVDFINAVQEVGMTACDMIVKGDPAGGNLKSSKWKSVYHFRRNHCYWIVVRNSKRCERGKDVQ